MAHEFNIEDSNGDLVDVVAFDCDSCHQAWCRETGNEYKGWNGCHEIQTSTVCAYCNEFVAGIDSYDDYQINPTFITNA